MVKRRGMRLEVDNPTEAQQRNKRWLAEHPFLVALVGAAVFGVLGALLGGTGEASGRLVIAAVLGAAMGGGLGWVFSVENRDNPSRTTRVAVYSVGALCLGGLVILKAL